MSVIKRSIKTDYVALEYIDVYSRVYDFNIKDLSFCFHAALFVTSSLLCIKRMKVVRKICIRPLVNHTVRLDVLRLCLDLIVSLVSRYYKDQQIVIVIFLLSFASEIEVTLAYIMLHHTNYKRFDAQMELLFYTDIFILFFTCTVVIKCKLKLIPCKLIFSIFLQTEERREELDLLARSICKLLKEQKPEQCMRI